MHIDGVDDKDIVYFNGEKIGENSGWNKARNYTIPAKLVKAGKAIVAIRIIDASGGGAVGFTDCRLRSL